MSLYRLEPDIQQLLRLERFAEEDFSSKEFIEKLSNSQRHAVADDELDPKPYIRTFEAVARELEKLLHTSSKQESTEQQRIADLTQQHNLNVIDIASNVDLAAGSIKGLDDEITEITRGTAQLSEHLERLSREHRHVIESKHLISYYLSFKEKGECPDLEKLWNSTDPSDHRQCAHSVGQLQLLARKLGIQQVEDTINEFAENLERYLINLFQQAYNAFDLVGMKEISEILFDFNGGSTVVQVFVNQHQFFMQADKIEDDSILKDTELWEKLSDPRSGYKEFEELFSGLIDEVTETVVSETDVITRVFPKPVQVLSVFMQRIFAQYIQGQVLLYTQEAESRALLAQARVLYVCYQRIGLMVKNLKDTWNKQHIDPDGELAATLDTSYADIFTMFINDRYFQETEAPVLKNIANKVFAKFYEAHNVPARASSHRYRDSSASVDEDEEDEESTMDRLMRAMRSSAGTSRKSVRVTPESRVQIDDLQLVLSAFAETVGRLQVLRPQTESKSDGSALFNLLMRNVAGSYINIAIEDAINKTNQDVRGTINWEYLQTVKDASNAAMLISAFVKTVLFAMVRQYDSTFAEMADNINQYVTYIQEQCTAILENTSDLVGQRIINILGKQKKKDFSPESDVDTKKLSPSAQEIIQMLESLEQQASSSLVGSNYKHFMHDVAMRLYDELLVHFKKYSTNYLGGKILDNDVSAYEALIVKEWGLTEVAENFATLKTLVMIFISDPSMLRSLLRDSRLQKIKPAGLREYMALRPDFYTRNLNLLFLQVTRYPGVAF